MGSEIQATLEEKISDRRQVYPKHCKICGVDTNYAYFIEDGKTHLRTTWMRCQCGVIFQEDFKKDLSIYTDDYLKDMTDAKQAKERFEYPIRLYAPLIEESTYGRMMLDVGFGVPFVMDAMKERGWLTWGIDNHPLIEGNGNIYKGDFLSYDFDMEGDNIFFATGVKKLKRKFDLIWIGNVLESVEDPLKFLKRAYDLLDPKGLLYISTPDIEFISKTGISGWPHFKGKEYNVLWSEQALCRELKRIGFKIVMSRRNFSSRFMRWWDIHIIAQGNYF